MAGYLIAMLSFAAIYAMMALGLNIMWGMAGMLNFGIAGFFAIGAYAAALTETRLGFPVLAGLASAAVACATASGLACLLLRRLRGDYFAIVTLGVAESVRVIADNTVWLTRGSDGISNISQPLRQIGSEPAGTGFLVLCVVILAVMFVCSEAVRASPFGRVLRAVRDDPQVALAAGKDIVSFQVRAFVIGGLMVGLSGGLYGHFTSYISPDIFVPLLTIYIFLAVSLGGRGNSRGTVLGSVLVVFVLESTRFLVGTLPFLSAVQVSALRGVLIGVLFLLVLQLRPSGLLPEPHPRLRRAPDREPLAAFKGEGRT